MRQDIRIGLAAALAALGACGGTLALYGLGVPYALGSVGMAAVAGIVIRGLVAPEAVAPPALPGPDRAAVLEATLSGMRHDIRGALSPAMMMTDRLLSHADPAVVRAGQAVEKSIDRAINVLADTKKAGTATHPDRP